ncbi:MAG: indole-3-glycerol phosphate synthase TrpC [Candidatus Humimicrobiaceae bacterium]
MDYLKKILANKKNEIKENSIRKIDPSFKVIPEKSGNRYGFIKNIKKNKVNVIAEIKKASPSRGSFNDDLDIGKAAALYDKYKSFICGISVITEPVCFNGNPEYIKEVKRFSDIPVLRKDFIFHESQIYESCEIGSDCILLISSILGLKKLKMLYEKATKAGLDVLVEVHNKEEFDRALLCGAEFIGINNRNLKNMEINLNTAAEIIDYAGEKNMEGKIVVCESGIEEIDYIKKMFQKGIYTFLIGSYFMKSSNLEKTLCDFESELKKEKLI